MTTQNGVTEIQITNEHLQELFWRLPAATEAMKATKALQEAIARIETLEAKVAAF